MDFNEYYSPEKYDPYSISSIFDYAKDLKGHTLADKCHSDILEKSYAGKGNFGHYLEKFYFGFDPNNNPEPDFSYVDVELKSGAIVETSKGFRAKERLAIGIINFSNIINESFESSHVWEKLKMPLLVFHVYKKDEDPRNYKVSNVNIVQYTNAEIAQIRDDWNLVKNKVADGKAHEISGGDTLFLEAATTGGKNQKYVAQPFSDELAHPRRFALKPAFVTTLLKKESYLVEEELSSNRRRNYSSNRTRDCSCSNSRRDFSPQTFLINKLKEYKDISLDEAISMLNIEKSTQKTLFPKYQKASRENTSR